MGLAQLGGALVDAVQGAGAKTKRRQPGILTLLFPGKCCRDGAPRLRFLPFGSVRQRATPDPPAAQEHRPFLHPVIANRPGSHHLPAFTALGAAGHRRGRRGAQPSGIGLQHQIRPAVSAHGLGYRIRRDTEIMERRTGRKLTGLPNGSRIFYPPQSTGHCLQRLCECSANAPGRIKNPRSNAPITRPHPEARHIPSIPTGIPSPPTEPSKNPPLVFSPNGFHSKDSPCPPTAIPPGAEN
jgi:hypothetical protein